MPEDVGTQEKNVWYTRLSIFYIAISKISDLKRHLPGFRLGNAQVKKSDNCIENLNPSRYLFEFIWP